MILKESIKMAKTNILFITTILIVSNFINYYLLDTNLFDIEWFFTAISLLIAFIFHALIISTLINKKKINPKTKKVIEDVMRLTTIYILSEITSSYFINNKIVITESFIKRVIILIIGIPIFDYIFATKFYNIGVYTQLLFDLIKIIVVTLLAAYYMDGKIVNFEISRTIGLVGGFIMWHIFTNRIIIK